jgi:hypothetical protein
MKSPRFRVRTVMIAVAVVAVLVAIDALLELRAVRFRQLAEFHLRASKRLEVELAADSQGQESYRGARGRTLARSPV